MLYTLKICLTLLFIDFAFCIVNEDPIFHSKASDGEEFKHVFEVDGLPPQSFYRDYKYYLFKAQGNKDIDSGAVPGHLLADDYRRLDDKFQSEQTRITFNMEDPNAPRKFILTIKKLEPKDSGIYTFQVRNLVTNKDDYLKKLFVYVHSKPKEIKFYGGNPNINFTEDYKTSAEMVFNQTEGRIICESVTPGYRKTGIKWDVDIKINGEDNAKLFDISKFSVDTTVKLEGGLPGMQEPMTYLTSTMKKFQPKPSYSGKKISCSLRNWKFSDLSIEESKTIKVRGRPNIYGPNNSIGGILTKEGIVYAEVVSSPEITSHEWRFKNKQLENTNEYQLKQDCMVENDAQKCNFTITFNNVLSSYYGQYTFIATNSFGSDQKEIKFEDEKDKASSSESNKLIPSVTMLIFIALLKLLS